MMEQDATIFEYDNVYDDIVAKRAKIEKRKKKDKVQRKSKYIKGLLENAVLRDKLAKAAKEQTLKRERIEN
eukprot:UN26921